MANLFDPACQFFFASSAIGVSLPVFNGHGLKVGTCTQYLFDCTIEWLHVTSSVCVAAIWAIFICKQWLCFILSFLNSKNGELLPSFGLP